MSTVSWWICSDDSSTIGMYAANNTTEAICRNVRYFICFGWVPSYVGGLFPCCKITTFGETANKKFTTTQIYRIWL